MIITNYINVSQLIIGGNVLYEIYGHNNGPLVFFERDIFIPAGLSLGSNSTNTGSSVRMDYEVL